MSVKILKQLVLIFLFVHCATSRPTVRSIDQIDEMDKEDLKTYLKRLIFEKEKALQQKEKAQMKADDFVRYYVYNIYHVVSVDQYPITRSDSMEIRFLKNYIRDVHAEKEKALKEKESAEMRIEDFKRNYALQKVTSDGPDLEKIVENYRTPNPCGVCFGGYRFDEPMTKRKPFSYREKKNVSLTN